MAKAAKDSKEENALVTQGSQALALDYGDDAVVVGSGPARGFEHQTAADGVVPFITVLQPMTPIVAEEKVTGARAGMLFNTVTQQLWGNPEGMIFVPATTRHQFTEFVPRDNGGGYRGQHDISSDIVKRAIAASKEFGEYHHPENGNELVETFYVFGALCDGVHPAGQAVIAFTSSKIKPYKTWISTVRMHTVTNPRNPDQKLIPPLYAHLTRITTEMKKNDKGTFHVPVLRPANGTLDSSLLAPNDPRFQAAKICKELVDTGAAKVDYNKAQEEGSGREGGSATPF